MQKNEIKLTVFYEDPYWIGIYEHVYNGRLEVCKITFGAEPKDYEVYQFLLQNWNKLRFSPPVNISMKQTRKVNPKRMRRNVQKQLEDHGVGTKSQQALKLQHEQNKTKRNIINRERQEEEKIRKFQLKQQKKKEKHRGR